jgi:sec-independent protein translocase protein TatA
MRESSQGLGLASEAERDYLVAMLLGFTLGAAEIAVIVLVVLLIFGPSKLPQLGSSVGKMLRGFKKEMKAINEDDDDDKKSAGEIDVTPHKAEEKPRPG